MMLKKIISIFVFSFISLNGSALVMQSKRFPSKKSEVSTTIRDENLAYELDSNLLETVNTFSTWIKLPTSLPEDTPGGIILGNFHFNKQFEGSCNFTVDKNGNFKLFWNAGTYEHVFSNTVLTTGEWIHIALTRDKENKKLFYYVNGILDEIVEADLPDCPSYSLYRVGMDNASWFWDLYGKMDSPFLGEIKQISLFKSCLSDTEINDVKSKTNITKTDYESVLTNLNFSNWGQEKSILDTSGQINAHLVSFNKAVPVNEVNDFDYSFVIVPDMQAMTYHKPVNFLSQSNWIVDNVEALKIKFVSYLGDMTESRFSVNPEASLNEWETAGDNIKMLDDVVPYSIAIGNHDYDNWAKTSRAATNFNNTFNINDYKDRSYFGGCYDGKNMENHFIRVNVGNIEYIIFALEEGPRTKVLKWVDRICDENPRSRIILTTHSYITTQGLRSSATVPGNGAPSKTITYDDVNNGEEMWQKSLSKHSNVVAVFSGHECCDDVKYSTDKGIYGNTVHQFLVDFQGSMMTIAMNTVLLVKVNEKNKTWDICAYWIDEDKCFNLQNQFQISLDDKFNPAI